MKELINILIIAIALSMDTFSVSLTIGTINTLNNKYIFTILVGIFHFLLPLIGHLIGSPIISLFSINAHHLLGFILLLLGIRCIFELNNDENYTISICSLIIIALTVSIDSFTTGLGLQAITSHIYLASLVFSITSSTFTLLGLKISSYALKKLKNKSKLTGIILLICLSILYLCQ